MSDNKKIGQIGEEVAAKYLENKGYKILDRNFEKRINSIKLGEIDIVAKDQAKKIIVFCEVKTLSAKKGFFPEDKVNFKKRETIAKVAEIWLNQHKINLDSLWQIDVLSIILDFNSRKAKIRHFKNI